MSMYTHQSSCTLPQDREPARSHYLQLRIDLPAASLLVVMYVPGLLNGSAVFFCKGDVGFEYFECFWRWLTTSSLLWTCARRGKMQYLVS
ncbi:hypothetical protein CALVIDRAFT_532689 [Calocera viscosa TUFC12733]|uniref:Uncharacterized protein n=1 Tax=Calocera viscosa (strain TUFC12733) TaxID=1330018 RepID=A0A167RMI4_CALVF|nr:hypothetical protein CALVIDRAFT_532689 [Calocera viscosa TUFC12733]